MILAFDSSSKTASAAIVDEGGRLLAQSFINVGLTHSETLMPMIAELLNRTEQPTHIAVTNGPGSFTGLRIGAACALGLAESLDIPICGVSSLEAAAWNAAHMSGYVRAVMDARRGQVYTALFYADNGKIERLTPDLALPVGEIFEKKGILVGDGAEMCYNISDGFTLAPPHLRYPTGYSVAMAAAGREFTSDLKMNYLRIPQAERERISVGGGNWCP
jgi:tRNA threonylcarbamoyladenosine biosynthesis protein TsaB